jgi:hypothetical protein
MIVKIDGFFQIFTRKARNIMVIIGICGKKFSGKDTMADYLVSRYGFTKMTYADGLKKACRELFMFSEEQCSSPRLKEVTDPRWGISPRTAFQMVGTDWVRKQFRQDFWVQRMRFHLEEEIRKNPSVRIVISDVRFENEKDLLQEKNGFVCGVHRFSRHQDNHESETGTDGFFPTLFLLDNNGTVQEFYEKIDDYLMENIFV